VRTFDGRDVRLLLGYVLVVGLNDARYWKAVLRFIVAVLARIGMSPIRRCGCGSCHRFLIGQLRVMVEVFSGLEKRAHVGES
jgi:hypothetical protein